MGTTFMGELGKKTTDSERPAALDEAEEQTQTVKKCSMLRKMEKDVDEVEGEVVEEVGAAGAGVQKKRNVPLMRNQERMRQQMKVRNQMKHL